MIYGLGFLLLRGISFFLLPLYTNLLSEFDAGVIFLIYTLLAFLNPVYAYGMNASLFKFYNNKNYSLTTTTTTSLCSLFFSSFILSAILILFSPFLNVLIAGNNPSLNVINWFFWLSCVLFFDSFSSRAFVLLRLQQRPYYFLFISFSNIILSLFCNWLFIKHYSLSSYGAVLAMCVVSCIQAALFLPIFISSIKLKKFNFTLFKNMISFAVPFLPSALLLVLISFSDRWFIKYYLNIESVGLYGAGYKLGSIMSLAVTAFNLNWQPYYLKNQNNNNEFGKIGSIAIVAFLALFVLLLVFIKKLIQIHWGSVYLVGVNFWDGVVVVPYVALGYFFYGIYILQMPSIFLLNKQNWGLLFWCFGALTNIAGNIILIPKLGIVGAGISSALAYFVMMLALVYKNFNWINIKYDYSAIASASFMSIVLLTIKYLLPNNNIIFFFGASYLLYIFLIIKKLQKKI